MKFGGPENFSLNQKPERVHAFKSPESEELKVRVSVIDPLKKILKYGEEPSYDDLEGIRTDEEIQTFIKNFRGENIKSAFNVPATRELIMELSRKALYDFKPDSPIYSKVLESLFNAVKQGIFRVDNEKKEKSSRIDSENSYFEPVDEDDFRLRVYNMMFKNLSAKDTFVSSEVFFNEVKSFLSNKQIEQEPVDFMDVAPLYGFIYSKEEDEQQKDTFLQNLQPTVQKIINDGIINFFHMSDKEKYAKLFDFNTSEGKLLLSAIDWKIGTEFGIKAKKGDSISKDWIIFDSNLLRLKDKPIQVLSSNFIKENFTKMEMLEAKTPGIVKKLFEDYNIEHFNRYPSDILEAQIKEENIQQPYGIIIFPKADHSGSFYSDAKRKSLSELFEDTRGHHGLKLFESGSKFDIARILLKCNQKYGANNKIDFAVLGAHGDLESMHFGNYDFEKDQKKELQKDDFKGAGTQKMKTFFNEHPTFVLISCSTGGVGGIGETISKEYGAKVFAPKETTTIKSMHVQYDEDGFRFNVEYQKEDSKRFMDKGI